MRDHQRFEKDILGNGITLYTYQDTFRTLNLELLLPVGAAHSHAVNGFLPGSAHFLEHIQLIRSSQYPDPYQLDRELGLLGGHSDGTTYPSWTSHWIDIPAHHTVFAIEAFMNRVFHPIFQKEDFLTERTVIMNERNQRTFYPGKSAATKHYYTQFLNDLPYSLEQMFGSDKDLSLMKPDRLALMHHSLTTSQNLVALAVGPHDFSDLKAQLSTLPTQLTQFTQKMQPTTWANPNYSAHYFDTITQPTLKVAWLHPRLSYEETEGLSFIISLLINTTHGPLYKEFREEKGWVYSLDGFCSQREFNTLIGLTFPVNEEAQIAFIRDCLVERIWKAVMDQTIVEHEITRCINNQIYSYQTASEIISSASQDIMSYGEIYSEKQWVKAIHKMIEPEWRRSLLERFFQKEDLGEVCYMPERRKLVPIRETL